MSWADGVIPASETPTLPSRPRIFVATHEDGTQNLVTLFGDGTGELAWRAGVGCRWSYPTKLTAVQS